jgi:hypothetical protein
MDQANAETICIGNIANIPRHTIDPNLAGIRRMHAAKNFDQRAFAGAILAEKGMNLPRTQLKIDAVKRRNAAEMFADRVERKERQVRGQRSEVRS